MKRRWLKDWPWETVVTINAGLCQKKKALHKPTSDGYEPAKKLWEKSRGCELTLRENFRPLPPVPQARAVLLLQWQHLCGDWANTDSRLATENAADESAQFSECGWALYRRDDWRR